MIKLRACVLQRVTVFALAGITIFGVVPSSVEITEASWQSAENATGTMAAGVVRPPTALTCSAGLLQPTVFNWTAHIAGGLTRTGYLWVVAGGINASGTLPASATSVTLSSSLIGLGSGTVQIYALGPGGWQSTNVSGSFSLIKIILDVNSTCSVP